MLALLASAAPLDRVLPAIVSAVHETQPGLALAILFRGFDDSGFRLHADPHLAADFLQALPACGVVGEKVADLAGRLGLDLLAAAPLPQQEPVALVVAHRAGTALPDTAWRETFDRAVQMVSIALEHERLQARLRDSESRRERLEMAIAGSATGIWDRNLQTGEIEYSDGWKALLGYGPSDLNNRIEDAYRRIHPEDLAQVQAAIQAHVDGATESYAVEHRIRCKDGSYKWIASRGRIVARDGEGRPLRMIGSTVDVTERKRIELELKEYATTDFLTRLPNRRHFLERMEQELVRVKRIAGARAAVLMCDLDHFKAVNDNFGHAVGDAVLEHFARVLRAAMRSIDFAGRVGGEEFAAVLPGASEADAMVLGRRLQQELAANPFHDAQREIALTVSIGIAMLQATDGEAGNALSRGDSALYRAKREGRNRIVR